MRASPWSSAAESGGMASVARWGQSLRATPGNDVASSVPRGRVARAAPKGASTSRRPEK